MASTDPYWKLRPPSTTPDDELCWCTDGPPIVLQAHLSPNPIACLKCNGEVPPERVGFPTKLAEGIAYWRHLHDALYALWLDSSDYELWARRQLEDPSGRVNVLGLKIVQELNGYHHAFFWWFQDSGDETFAPLSRCPRCSASLAPHIGRLVCESCRIVVPNG
jgi:hypothetical protein